MSHMLGTVGVTSITDITDASKALGVNLTGATTDTMLTLAVSQTANRTVTLPDATTTVLGHDTTQIVTNKTIYEPQSLTLTAAGTNQGTATQLSSMQNIVTTTPLNSGVVLPIPAGQGLKVVVANYGANTLRVYPATGGTIDAAAANAPVFVPPGATATYGSQSSGSVWFTINPVIVFGSGTTVTYGNGEAAINVGNNGTLSASNGGTGITSTPTNGQILIGNGSGFTLATLTSGTGINVTNSAGAITIANTGVTSLTASTGISVNSSTGAITVTNTGVTSFSAGTTGFSPTSASTGAVVLSGRLNVSNGGTGITATPTNGQILIGNGSGFTLATLTAGSGLSVANASGAITLSNTGVTSLTASTGISVSASTGAITVTNTGVTSFQTSLSGLTPSSASTGVVTLAGTLGTTSGGTGTTVAPTAGQLLVGQTGGTFVPFTVTTGTGISTVVGSGTFQINNTGVTSFSAGTTGLSVSASVGAVTLGGTLAVTNGGTGVVSPSAGALLVGNGSSAMTQLADVAVGSALTSGGVGVAPTWTAFTSNAIASTLMSRDVNANTRVNNLIEGYTTTVTAAGTTTLSVASTKQQFFTGTTTQTVVLPSTSTLVVGQQYEVINTSTGAVTVQTATPTVLTTVASGVKVVLTCINTASDSTTSWNVQTATGGGGGAVSSVSGTTNQITASPSTGAVVLSTPSTFIAPGTIQDTTGMLLSTNATVTAAGATQGTATALTRSYNVVTTVASNTGVALPTPSTAGLLVTVVNKGANTLRVYPATGGAIDSAGTNAFVSLAPNGSVTYEASSTTNWLTVNPPVVAGTNIQVAYGNGQTLISSTATITATEAVIGPVGLNTQQPIAFVSATSNGGQNITSLTINTPSGVTRDMTMVSIITLRTTGAYGTMTTPVGWDLIDTRMDNTGGPTYYRKVFFFFKTTTASEPASYTWSGISPGTNWVVGGIQMFTNVAAFNIINAAGTLASGTQTLSFNVPSITTNVANTMLVAFYTYASCSVSWTTSGGMTQSFTANSQPPPQEIGENCMGAWKTNASAGAVGGVGVFTATASGAFPDYGFSCLIALTPIAVGSIILATEGALDVGSKNSTFINFGNQNAPTNMYNLTSFSGYDTASPLTLVASAQQSATILSCLDADNVLLSGINSSGQFFIGGSAANAFVTTFANTPTANRTITFPDITDTVVTLTAIQTVINKTVNLSEYQASNPSAPVAGSTMYSALRAGKNSVSTIGPTGYAHELQRALYSSNVYFWQSTGNGSTVFLMNFGNTATGTVTTRNIASTNYFTSSKRIGYVSSATAGNSAGTRHGIQQFWRGDAPGLGGFFYVARFGLSSPLLVLDQRSFVGLVGQTTVLSNANPSTRTNILGFGVDSADSTWTFMHNDGAGAATKDALTGTFPPRDINTTMYEARIYCAPNDTTVYYSLEVLNGGSLFEGSTNTNIPSNTTFLSPQIWTNNGTTALAAGIDVVFQYIETEY